MQRDDRVMRAILAMTSIAALLSATAVVSGIVYDQRSKLRREYQEYQTEAPSRRNEAAKEIYQSCDWIPVETARSNCIVGKLEAASGQDAANEDLQAQQDMAFWASAVFWSSFLQIIFSGVGIYWIIRAFGQTDAALRLNRTALVEAQKANVIAGIAASNEFSARQAELRAYIGVFQAMKVAESSTDKVFCAAIEFQNFGATPAYEVVTRRGIGIFDAKVVEQDAYGERSTLPPTDPNPISPTQAFRASATIAISAKDSARLKKGDAVLILYGEIEYLDLMKEKRSTLFNIECRGYGTSNERLAPRGKFNDAT